MNAENPRMTLHLNILTSARPHRRILHLPALPWRGIRPQYMKPRL